MLGKGAAVVAVAIVAAVAATAAPEPAQAFNPGSPFESLVSGKTASSFWSAFRSLIAGESSSTTTAYGTLVNGETATTQSGLKSMLYRAGVKGRFLPVLGTVATRLTVAGTVGYIGWRIYRHYNGGDQTIDLWIDSETLGKDSLYNPLGVWGTHQDRLRYSGGSGVNGVASVTWEREAGTECTAFGAAVLGTDCWVLDFHAGAQFGSEVKWTGRANNQPKGSRLTERWPDWDQCELAGAVNVCNNGWSSYPGTLDPKWGSQVSYMVDRTITNLISRTYGGYNTVVTRFVGDIQVGGIPTYDTRAVALPLLALGPDLGVTGESGTELTAPTVETEYTAPADAGEGDGEPEAMLQEFDSPCGRALLNHLLAPAFYPWVPGCIEVAPAAEPEPEVLTLLRPMVNETYADYITRLQAEGWVGSATLVELGSVDPTLGPEAVQRIGITGQTGAWYRSLWPATWPQIALDTDLTLWHNPELDENDNPVPPAPPDPTDDEPPGGGEVFDPGGCDPWLEADPDFSPLTSLNFGSKFPFGLFAWAGAILGAFNASPDAPQWTIDVNVPSTSVSPAYDLGEFTIDLEWLDEWMDEWRLLVTFVLWIGAVWFLATGLLGVRGANPVEAADDGPV